KWPRFAFEKFPGVDPTLSTHMKSVGEAMAIGRTFQQAFAKALRSRELDKPPCLAGIAEEALLDSLRTPEPARFETVLELLGRGERESVVILGSGPNRIGQGIEFDYCCVHAAMTVRESGRDAVIVNCNPETVSTDYDTSDRLYFEPLTLEDVLAVVEVERPAG